MRERSQHPRRDREGGGGSRGSSAEAGETAAAQGKLKLELRAGRMPAVRGRRLMGCVHRPVSNTPLWEVLPRTTPNASIEKVVAIVRPGRPQRNDFRNARTWCGPPQSRIRNGRQRLSGRPLAVQICLPGRASSPSRSPVVPEPVTGRAPRSTVRPTGGTGQLAHDTADFSPGDSVRLQGLWGHTTQRREDCHNAVG